MKAPEGAAQLNSSPVSQESEFTAWCSDSLSGWSSVKLLPQIGRRNLRRTQDRQWTYNVILRRVHVTFLPRKIRITNTECGFVALVIQHAKRMGSMIMSPLTWQCVVCVYMSNTTIFIGSTRILSIYYIRHSYIFRPLMLAVFRLYMNTYQVVIQKICGLFLGVEGSARAQPPTPKNNPHIVCITTW